jgi:hypothetical protein
VSLREKRNTVLNNLSGRAPEGFELSVARSTALAESLPTLLGPAEALRSGLKSFVFTNEVAYGGSTVDDWFTEVASQLTDSECGLFVPSPDKPHYLMFDSSANRFNPMFEEFYRATGRLLALAFTSKQMVGLNFPTMFFGALLELPVSLEDIRDYEPFLYTSYTYILEEVETKDDYTLTIDGVDLPVTSENKQELVRRAVNSLMPRETREIFEIVRAGFDEVVPIALIRQIFTPRELRDVVIGRTTVNVEDLMDNLDLTESRYTQGSLQIKWLRAVLQTFDQRRRRQFVHFVTGCPQVPATGFRDKRIKVVPVDSREALPEASNCFNQLRLPRYLSRKTLEQKLTQALDESREMED